MSKSKIEPLSQEERDAVYSWAEKIPEGVPDCVMKMIRQYKKIELELKDAKQKGALFLKRIRIAMGIEPSSERKIKKKLRSEKTKDDRKRELIGDRDYHAGRSDWHNHQRKKHKMMEKSLNKKIKSIDDIELSPEDLADSARETKAEQDILGATEHIDENLILPKEALMTGIDAQMNEESFDLDLPTDEASDQYVNTFYEERTRYGGRQRFVKKTARSGRCPLFV